VADDEMGEDADSLPEDLDVTALSGRYTFPDIRRRRIAGWLYVGVSAVCLLAWVAASARPVLVNRGVLLASLALLVFGSYHLATAWPLTVREVEALVAAARQVGFPVGHASAQLGWRGLRSRPTWRILLYSGEEPPTRRGLVLVDAVEGNVLSHFVEDNPEDWSAYDR
jgi:hypothetical protein